MTNKNKNDWTQASNASTWKYEKPGDEIVGLLDHVEDASGFAKSKRYYIERQDNHEIVGVWGSTVLDNRMAQVKIGQEVKIVYKGKAASKARPGAQYKDFDVFYRDANVKDYDTVDLADKAKDIFD